MGSKKSKEQISAEGAAFADAVVDFAVKSFQKKEREAEFQKSLAENQKPSRPTMSHSDFSAYVDELYDHGLDGHEVDEVLRSNQLSRRENPQGHDFDNQYVWNTSDRLDRALTLAARRQTMIRDYQKRLQEVDGLLESIRIQMGFYGDTKKAQTLVAATRAYIATPAAPWAEKALTTDLLLCSICRCDLCNAKIEDESLKCCDHKDDVGSWGLPF